MDFVEQALGVTCKQGYFKATTEMVKPLRGRIQHKTRCIYQSGSMDRVQVMPKRLGMI